MYTHRYNIHVIILIYYVTYTVPLHTYIQVHVVDLVKGGRNIPVTDDNKHEYVQLVAQHRMVNAIRKQVSKLKWYYTHVT